MFTKSEFYNIALDKARVAFGVKSDNKLAEIIGCHRTALYQSRSRGTFPAKALMDACVDHNVSLDFILGINSKKISNGAGE
jgi:hypothetical protein